MAEIVYKVDEHSTRSRQTKERMIFANAKDIMLIGLGLSEETFDKFKRETKLKTDGKIQAILADFNREDSILYCVGKYYSDTLNAMIKEQL